MLQLILLGVSAVFWYGFAVPYGPVFGIPEVILIASVWPELSKTRPTHPLSRQRGLIRRHRAKAGVRFGSCGRSES